MENQHRLIKGYKELSEKDIAAMNCIKEMGVAIQDVVEALQADSEVDQRWISIGKTHMQQGLMALTRGVAKPEFF